jgi:hypothetical protein
MEAMAQVAEQRVGAGPDGTSHVGRTSERGVEADEGERDDDDRNPPRLQAAAA